MEYYGMRLLSNEHFDSILNVNNHSKIFKPENHQNHIRWIKSAVEQLKNDNYKTMAFGAFQVGNPPILNVKLLSTVIIIKKEFSERLELKNLIHHDVGDKEFVPQCRERLACYKTLITYVKKFAATRGYETLSSELVGLYEKDKSLLQAFLDCGFTITGNRNNFESGSIYLTFQLPSLYNNDPFDYQAITEWILKKFINANPSIGVRENNKDIIPFKEPNVEITWNGNKKSKLVIASYFVETTKETLLNSFNFEIKVLVLVDSIYRNNNRPEIEKIDLTLGGFSTLYVFYFGEDHFFNMFEKKFLAGIQKNITVKFITANSINKLISGSLLDQQSTSLGKSFYLTGENSISKNDLNGLISISDPDRFSINAVSAIQNSNKSPIYIKLGSTGKSLCEDDFLVLSYYTKDSGQLSVWCVIRLGNTMEVDLTKVTHEGSNNFKEDAALYSEIETHLDDGEKADDVVIWPRAAFCKHNRFNPSNKMICCWIEEFWEFKEKPIPLSNFIKSNERLEELNEWSDSYLTKQEVDDLLECIGDDGSEKEQKSIFPCRLTFFHSSPEDLPPIIVGEKAIIKDAITNRNDLIQENGAEYHFDASYSDWCNLNHKLHSGILHISSHAEKDGRIVFSDETSQKSREIPLSELLDFLKHERIQFSLIIFNCCYSNFLAQNASKYSAFTIGFTDALVGKAAMDFTRHFYRKLATSRYQSNETISVLSSVLWKLNRADPQYPDATLWVNESQVNLQQELLKYHE
jgi:hypothetical protein